MPGVQRMYPHSVRPTIHRKVLFNGQWDGHTWLDRFVVRNGVLRGANIDGRVYTTSAKGPLRKVEGASITNTRVPLSGLGGDEIVLEALYSINGLGQVVKSPVPDS